MTPATPTTRKTSILVYGASDSGKSTQARYVAEYIHRTTGKKTRLIALDRGSLWAPCQDLVDAGIVQPLEFPTSYEFNPMAVMRKLRRGEWPEGGVILKPTAREEKKPNGVEIKYVSNTKWLPWGEKESAEIGAIVVDSLTTFATAFMSDTKQKNIRVGSDAGSAPRSEEGEQMGTNTQSHYGDCHTEILDSLQSFQALPVEISLFTALEGIGADDDSGIKRPVLGPETIGKAIHGKLPSRVNHCLHLVAEGVGREKKVNAWYNKHASKEVPSMFWPAKVSFPPARLQEFWKLYPAGYIPLTLDKGIGALLEFINSTQSAERK